MTEGRKLLLLALSSTTQSAIGDRVGVSQPAVAGWVSGSSKPGFHARHKLADHYGINVHAWDRDFVAPAVAPAAA